jgi:hypothetical protein
MRQYPLSVAIICGLATLGTVSAASAGGWGWGGGCGCGAPVVYGAVPYTVTAAFVAQPVVVATPYVVPYVHGYDFYHRSYYSNGPYGNPVGYRGYYHPYADMPYSGLPGTGYRPHRVGPDYVRARHLPEWRFARHGTGYYPPAYRYGYRPYPYHAPLRPEDK